MTRSLFALSLGFAGLILAVQAAKAGPQCAQRTEVLRQLSDTYGEARQAIGLSSNAAVMELHANTREGSWTITVTRPDGLTCLVASGQGFEALAEPLPARGAPA